MNHARPFEPPMPEPLAFFLTWPAYGTWLPGDERGWVKYRSGWKPPDPTLKKAAAARMTEDACVLTREQRIIVEQTIRDHCVIRSWELFAVSCRSNHVHVVVAANISPKEVCRQFKSWCTRRLKDTRRHQHDGPRNLARTGGPNAPVHGS